MSKPTKPYPRILEAHEYMSIDFGNNRRLTTSYSGVRASGSVPLTVFNTWDLLFGDKGRGEEVINPHLAKKRISQAQRDFLVGPATKGTVGERVQAFVSQLDSIWPEWKIPPRAFIVGEGVKFDFGQKRGGIQDGTVIKVGRTITVRFGTRNISMAADLLAQFNPISVTK